MLKQILHRYMPGKKFLAPEFWEKHSYQTKSPIAPPQEKSNGQPHRGWERSGFGTLVDVIRQQKNGWRAFIMWWFSRPKFRVLSLKIRR